MRSLKALVIGMGILIVVGVVFLIYAIIQKSSENDALGRSALQSEVTWADLAAENLCLLTPDMQNRRIINQCFMEADVTPDALVEANSTLVLAAIVEQGGWVTVLPGDMARFLAAGKGLAVVPIAGAHVEHKVGLVAPHRQPHTPVLEALLRAAQGLATR